jgi:hypothetical protein
LEESQATLDVWRMGKNLECSDLIRVGVRLRDSSIENSGGASNFVGRRAGRKWTAFRRRSLRNSLRQRPPETGHWIVAGCSLKVES